MPSALGFHDRWLSLLDLRREHVEASRSFSRLNDLWIADHRPSSPSPILWSPHHDARDLHGIRPHPLIPPPGAGVRQVRFMDMISCPPSSPVFQNLCREPAPTPGSGMRGLSIRGRDLPHGPADRRSSALHGTGAPRCGRGELAEGFQDFPVRPDELRTLARES